MSKELRSINVTLLMIGAMMACHWDYLFIAVAFMTCLIIELIIIARR